jgi:hypothetical protein
VALNISIISVIGINESVAYIPSFVPWDNKISTKQSTGLAFICVLAKIKMIIITKFQLRNN